MDCNPKLIRELGRGQDGVVFTTMINNNEQAVKRARVPLDIEYNIMDVVYKVIPKTTPKPIKYVKCSGYDLFYFEYLKGDTLHNRVNNLSLNPNQFPDIIRNVITSLVKVQRAHPTFRHNDLHLNNLFMTDDGATKIIDYGLSNIEETCCRNAKLNGYTFKTEFGIAPNSDKRYDIHLFLNSLNGSLIPAETRSFLERVLPPAYRGKDTDKIMNFRLRYGIDHKSLPSITAILNDPYLKKHIDIPKETMNCGQRANPKEQGVKAMKADDMKKFIQDKGTPSAKKALKDAPKKTREVLCNILKTFPEGRALFGPAKKVNVMKMIKNYADPINNTILTKGMIKKHLRSKGLKSENYKANLDKYIDNRMTNMTINNVISNMLNNCTCPNTNNKGNKCMCPKPNNKGKAKMVNNGAGPSKSVNKGKKNLTKNEIDAMFSVFNKTDMKYNNEPGKNINFGLNESNELNAANFTYYKEGQIEDPIKLMKKSMNASKQKTGTKMYKKLGAKQMATKGGPLELIPVGQIKKSKTAQKIIVPPKKPVQFMKFNKPVNKDPTKSIPTQPAKMIITTDKITDANKILAKKMAWNKMKINNTGENYERYVKNAMNKIMASKSQ
jgi:tRNA A-37 threonylcarbamoyl transferase component Bud32